MNTEPLSAEQIQSFLSTLSKEWKIQDNKLCREFTFPDFAANIAFVNAIAAIAEEADHHPDLHIHYNKLLVELWTHSADGMSEADFQVAQRIDRL